MDHDLSRLRIGNEEFLVASMIERCPKTMMLRELVKNALEATERPDHTGTALRHVEIGAMRVDGVRKLAIWNTGLGMTAAELFRMCDIASSIGKANALDQNFGMGAKVASLPSNQHGVRYRSCRDRRVHQVLMGKRDGWYGRIRQPAPDGTLAEVIDVTEAAAAEGYGSSVDWTEVVLLGNRAEQDTLADPYDQAPAMPPGWIAAELYRRFFALPPGIGLTLKPGSHLGEGDQAFQTPRARLAVAFARYEAVTAERGVIVHFGFDPPDAAHPGRTISERGALQPAEPGIALAYKGEIYDVRRGGAWVHDAPLFGFAFGARQFSLTIELPDDHPVLPDAYRQFLRWRDNAQHHVEVGQFTGQVAAARPGWVLELLRQLAPDARHVDAARGEMASLFARLRVRRRWFPPVTDAVTPPAVPPAPSAEPAEDYEVPPQIVPLRDADDVRERGLEGVAARFYADTHQLFMNLTYRSVSALAELLRHDRADDEANRAAVQVVAESLITRQVCRRLVFALAKRDDWAPWQVDQAASPYSLTLAADDYAELIPLARHEVRRELARQMAKPAKEAVLF